jgi:carbonic anhydrase
LLLKWRYNQSNRFSRHAHAACINKLKQAREIFMSNMIGATEALQRLREGNERFASNLRLSQPLFSHDRRAELVAGQEPFAIILGCSDSRVPAEIVFDQGLGDLFVIRVAGNIVAPSQIGSVEFAVSQYGTRLVVVLGHSQCGAILATIDELRSGGENPRGNIKSIVNRVKPSVEGLMSTDLRNDYDALVREAVRANVRTSANHLRHGSEIIEGLIESDGLLVVGAEYSLETGKVDFFDGMP